MGRSLLQDEFDRDAGFGIEALKARRAVIDELVSQGYSEAAAIAVLKGEADDPGHIDLADLPADVLTTIHEALGDVDDALQGSAGRRALVDFLRDLSVAAVADGDDAARDRFAAAAEALAAVVPADDGVATKARDGFGRATKAEAGRDVLGRSSAAKASAARDGFGRRKS